MRNLSVRDYILNPLSSLDTFSYIYFRCPYKEYGLHIKKESAGLTVIRKNKNKMEVVGIKNGDL